MHLNQNKAKNQVSNQIHFNVSREDSIKTCESNNKSIGFGHIRMRSNIKTCEQLKEKNNKKECNQWANAQIQDKQIQQEQWSQFQELMNSQGKIQNRNITKPLKRPVSSFENICATRKQNANMYPTNAKLKSFTSLDLDLARTDMQSICSKMTQSIILSSDTAESITERKAELSNKSFDRIKFLGQGKFGQVYLVRHKQTGFICALKIIDKKIVRQEKVQSQLAKQIKIHSRLHCLNIIQFYGFFSDDKNLYIALQYATQGSVFSKLKGKSRLQQQQIQPIAKGLCDGLRFIHGMGFVHRDIKPQNIVMQFGVPKICDFGWATNCGEYDLCKSYCGTPLYLSPQMIKKQFYGTSVDIWSLGLVIYELLVGRIPFRVWNQQDMNQILTKQIQFPEYIDRSPKCESFIRKCLEKQTYNRMELHEALRHPFINEGNQSKFLSYSFLESSNNLLTKSV